MAPQPLRPGAGRAGRLLGPLRRASSLLAWTGKGSGGGCPNQCQSQACFMNLNFLLPCREAVVRRRWLVPGAPSGWGLCLYLGGRGYQLAWWERECLPPNPARPLELPAQLLLSPTLFLLTSLLWLLPTQLSGPSFTLQAAGQDCGPFSLCLKNWGWQFHVANPCQARCPCSWTACFLPLSPPPLSPSPFPPHHMPTLPSRT